MMSTDITIVGFGNSITQATTQMPEEHKRWLNVLNSRLTMAFPNHRFKVVNSGVGGNSAREAMARFERDVLAHHPDWVLLEFGGNNDDPVVPSRRVTEDEFRGHLKVFRNRLPAKTKVMVITFPSVVDERISSGREWYQQFGGPNAALERFRVLTRTFAAEHGFPLVDLSEATRREIASENGNRYILADGVHLTAAGNRLLAEMVFDVLRKEFKA